MIGFPYALLYEYSKYRGVGLTLMSDTITIDRLRNLYACLQSDHYIASAGNGLLSRAVRLQYGMPRPDQFLRLQPVKGATYYMKNTIEWRKHMDCYLRRHVQRPAELTIDATLEEIATPTLTTLAKRKPYKDNTLVISEILHDTNTEKFKN